MARYFTDIIAFMVNGYADDGKVLVHCFCGISRAATAVAAYLIEIEDFKSVADAIEFLASKRGCIYPNNGFLGQLVLLCLTKRDKFRVYY